MTDFKTSKQLMYSTPFCVRNMLDVLSRDIEDDDGDIRKTQDINDRIIEQHIYNADGVILTYLSALYGADALVLTTPYFKGPTHAKNNSCIGVNLTGVVVASTAITEQWLIEFTDDDTYRVTGSFSGSQGTGTVGADFTSTNSDLQIKSVDWHNPESVTITKGNQFILGTYVATRIVNTVSSMLAASTLINSLYSIESGSEPTWARRLNTQAMSILKALIDPKSEVSLTSDTTPETMEAISWTITRNGDDVSDYGDYGTTDYNPMDV